ncbi:MAG: carboxypeptidase-like regulatory domain-containing protein, partial [Candidatus Hermodarchaeota archaeon]
SDLESDATATLSIQGPNGFSHVRFYAAEGSDTINLNTLGVCEPGEYSMTLDVENSDGEANSESLTLLLTDDDVAQPEVLVNNIWEFQDNVEFLDITLIPTDPSGISNVYADFSGNEYYYDIIDLDGTYHILIPNPHELGTYDIDLWVWDNDNDRTDDKKNTMIPLTFTILDDDIDPPIVDIGDDWIFEDEEDLLEIVFTATDISGISDIYASFSGEEYHTGEPDEDGYYHLFLPNPHNLGYYSFDLWVWDGDNDRLDDSEAYITKLSFEIIDDDTEAPLIEVSDNWMILDSDGFLEILVEATDPSGIHAVYAKFGDLEYYYDSIDGDGNYHIYIPNPIELGLYSFELWVWDDDNDHIGDRKAVTTTLHFTVVDDDTDQPDFSELNTWEIPDNVENLEIIIDVFDASGISEVYAIFDGDTYAGIFINGYYYIDIPNPRTPGQYHVDVWAWDNDNDREGDRTARDYIYWFTVFDDDTAVPTVILPEGLIIEDKDPYLEIILEAWDLSGIHNVCAIFDSTTYQGILDEGDGLYHIFIDNPHELGTYIVDVRVWDDDYDFWDGDRKEFTDSLSFTVEDDDVEAPSIFLYENSYSWDGTKIKLTFTVTAVDSSGISEISAEIGGYTFYAYLVDVATFEVSLDPEIYTIQISVTDDDNDRMDDSLTAYLYDELIFDLTPPLTSLEFNPFYDDELGGIFVTTTTLFTLGTSDDVSGVAHTYYWINNSPVYEDILTFSLTGRLDGTYRIYFYSIDMVGNVEGVKYVDVILVSLNIESYISNGVSGDVINEFDVIFRKCKENGIEGFKLVATNPGQIFYHININNYWPISVDELIVNTNIPFDFEKKGCNPIHVFLDGEQITDSCILVDGLITIFDIPSGSLVEIIVHLDYGLKDTFYEILENFWLKFYSFEPVIQAYGGDSMDLSNYLVGTYTTSNEFKAFEKKTTAIAGFVMNQDGYRITGALVQLQQSDGTVFETITDENGFYFFTDIPSGDFQIRIVHEDIPTEWEWVSVLKEIVTWFDYLVPILIP